MRVFHFALHLIVVPLVVSGCIDDGAAGEEGDPAYEIDAAGGASGRAPGDRPSRDDGDTDPSTGDGGLTAPDSSRSTPADGGRVQTRDAATDESGQIGEICRTTCELAIACNVLGPSEDAFCGQFCVDLEPEMLECFAGAQQCPELFQCLRDLEEPGDSPDRPGPGPGPGQPPSDRGICDRWCSRHAQCVDLECAPNTATEDFVAVCGERCAGDPPTVEVLQTLVSQRCEAVIAEIRDHYPSIDARCDADEGEICERLCEESVAPCADNVHVADCVDECARWSGAVLLCVERAPQCRAVNACFVDDDTEARCGRWCARLDTCLTEACPPRVIPPDLSLQCTANCLRQPPSVRRLEQIESAECRAVRNLAYQQNPQLRPVCEGGREFRPTPDECAAFCDNVLQACLGLDNRGFCLAGCAALERDQYACALEMPDNCDAVLECIQ